MQYLLYLGIAFFILICLMLILIVLIQKGRGGGLASAFGGAGGNTAFGAKTGDVLTWVTSVIFGIFLLLAVGLNLLSDYHARQRVEAARAAAGLTAEQQTDDVQQPVEPESPPTTQTSSQAPASQPTQP